MFRHRAERLYHECTPGSRPFHRQGTRPEQDDGRVVVADESLLQNGPASYIAERIESEAFYHLEAPVEVVGVDDTPIPFSPLLAEAVVPGADQIEEAVRSLPRL